ncbi:MAG TPA: type II toxin-antitoxin system VapB family antitoxin [Candidatus Cybelea sp.]|nr:type II toxin-antitoxin system VapB family antitoxin [Candidatus Cybelea sp.]
MALSIKDPEADRLARALAKVTGETLTDAVTNALRDRLRLVTGDGRTPEQFNADVMAIVNRYASRRVVDDRTADEIIGYDERGLPS